MNPILKKLTIAAAIAAMASMTSRADDTFPYQNPQLSADERAADLCSRLTTDEKVKLMMNSSPAIERLGIPAFDWWSEALHGVGRNGLATVFPSCIGMAASFNDSLIYDVFTAVSDEARAKNTIARRNGRVGKYRCLSFWTPTVNIFRDPRWGRGQETYGEDPYMNGRMGSVVIKALQGPSDTRYRKLLACAKHFAVHSGPEKTRHSFDAKDIDPRDLHETYLPAFKALVDAGVGQVMCAYNRFESEPCCSNKKLLQQILRNDWGYQGIVVSDCGAISDLHARGHHETYPNVESASAAAVISGTDLECGGDYRNLPRAVEQGLITEDEINRSLRRLLVMRYELGEMDDYTASPWAGLDMSIVDSQPHRDFSLDMTRKSLVLLKNNGILPLKRSTAVAIVGPNADNAQMQWGNYEGRPSYTFTIAEGLKNKNAASTYDHACDYFKIDEGFDPAKIKEDIVVFVGGISPDFEGEEKPVDYPGFIGGDRTTIELPAAQREAIAALKKAGKKVIFVNCSGSAVALTPENEIADAILQAWYPGQAGGLAVADIIYGDYNPSGRLPVTFYADDSQLPDFNDYSMVGRTYRFLGDKKPLYHFGYGLSYTTFDYGKGRLSRKSINAGENVRVTVPVTNTGSRRGTEVVQVYVRRLDDVAGPDRSLRAFARQEIMPGRTADVVLDLDAEAFASYDPESGRMGIVPGKYEISYGPSSAPEALKTLSLTVK